MITYSYLYNQSAEAMADEIVNSMSSLTMMDTVDNMTSPYNNNNTAHTEIPTHNFTDYVEMILYVLMSVGGGAVNVFCARRLIGQYRRKTINLHQVRVDCIIDTNYCIVQFDLKSAFLLLKIHLTLANLLVLVVMCPIRFMWLVSYRWPLGRVMCTACGWSDVFKTTFTLRNFSIHFCVLVIKCDPPTLVQSVQLSVHGQCGHAMLYDHMHCN
jgi:hypothetical protein